MNEITSEPRSRSVLLDMAMRYGMEASAFEATVRATCSPGGQNVAPLTREEFAAFLLVAKEYRLNPLTREIYAFPKKGGGVVPIVSIDGWVSLVNSHGAFDGVEFDMNKTATGELESCTCRIYRKDRTRPIEVTEYLAECIRQTDPWKMKNRMLRHKALIQCARYAFGFSGIYDEDEGTQIAEGRIMRDVTPAPAVTSAVSVNPLADPRKAAVASLPAPDETAIIVNSADIVLPSDQEREKVAVSGDTETEADGAHQEAEQAAEPGQDEPEQAAPPILTEQDFKGYSAGLTLMKTDKTLLEKHTALLGKLKTTHDVETIPPADMDKLRDIYGLHKKRVAGTVSIDDVADGLAKIIA